jgi:hypothetical protein
MPDNIIQNLEVAIEVSFLINNSCLKKGGFAFKQGLINLRLSFLINFLVGLESHIL